MWLDLFVRRDQLGPKPNHRERVQNLALECPDLESLRRPERAIRALYAGQWNEIRMETMVVKRVVTATKYELSFKKW